jgi:glycosyltransferase involved in cell wall biosynthesis
VPKVSVTIITRNEAAHIGPALQSAAWADELIVVDSESSDDTVGIAKQYTDRVIVRPWPGYIAQKNFAASVATCDWILSLDADERITPRLAAEIRHALSVPPRHAAFRIPRVTWHLGRWIRTTDWYPDCQPRLYNRGLAEWTGRYVHESLSVRGSIGRLANELHHYAYDGISDHLETIDRYTTYAARQMHEQGRRAGFVDIAVHPPLAFLRNYLLRGGIRDGTTGLIVAAMNSCYVLLKFAKLWEMEHARAPKDPASGPGA